MERKNLRLIRGILTEEIQEVDKLLKENPTDSLEISNYKCYLHELKRDVTDWLVEDCHQTSKDLKKENERLNKLVDHLVAMMNGDTPY